MLVRTVLFPVRLTWGVGKASAKGGYKAGRASVVGSYKAGHLLGYRRMATLALGVGIGLLLAPSSGQELRDKLKASLAGGSGGAPTPPLDTAASSGAVDPAPLTRVNPAAVDATTPPPADADS